MQTNVQEFYVREVLPLSEQERLKIASLILNDLVKADELKDARQNRFGVKNKHSSPTKETDEQASGEF